MKAAVLAVALVLIAGATAAACGGRARASGPTTIHITVHHSRFEPSAVRVKPGDTVRFVIRNTDPIEHEFIVGDQAVQDMHEVGTDALHNAPGAVSIRPESTAETAYTFPRQGHLLFGCHLPGHWAYGMRGTITLTTNA